MVVSRLDLVMALQTLSTIRRRRFASSMPIWMNFYPESNELHIVEERGQATASIPATGHWPPIGTTVDLFMLKRAVTRFQGDVVELHALENAVVLCGDHWQVRLNLLAFGPESRRPVRTIEAPLIQKALPLFLWAERRRASRGQDPFKVEH